MSGYFTNIFLLKSISALNRLSFKFSVGDITFDLKKQISETLSQIKFCSIQSHCCKRLIIFPKCSPFDVMHGRFSEKLIFWGGCKIIDSKTKNSNERYKLMNTRFTVLFHVAYFSFNWNDIFSFVSYFRISCPSCLCCLHREGVFKLPRIWSCWRDCRLPCRQALFLFFY